MLKPLQQWICDSCGEIIKEPEHGYVEWMEERLKKHGFRIVHHATKSPRKGHNGCYYSDSERGGDLPVSYLIGLHGLVELTSWIDPGEYHEPTYNGPEVIDLREWTTLFRRLHIPYYEEARLCTEEFQEVRADGANELYLYLPETLERIVRKHESHAA
jgi:hypothetical protein